MDFHVAKIKTATAAALLLLAAATVLPACDGKLPRFGFFSKQKTKKAKPKSEAAVATPKGKTPQRLHFKAALGSGDNSSPAFDNARRRLAEILMTRGVAASDIAQLSMGAPNSGPKPSLRVAPMNPTELNKALGALKIKKGDACFVHLTSHGSPWGFYVKGEGNLTPAMLDAMLTKNCGEAPTFVFVSACYSGVFTSNIMKTPNRAIFTAARDDRNSFGCGVENQFTYWDACLIDLLPEAATPRSLASKLTACIRAKERNAGLRYSFPQAALGEKVADTAWFGPVRKGPSEAAP